MSPLCIYTPQKCIHTAARDLFKNIHSNGVCSSSWLEIAQKSITAKWICALWDLHAVRSKKALK